MTGGLVIDAAGSLPGDAVIGKKLYLQAGVFCASCDTLKAAGAPGATARTSTLRHALPERKPGAPPCSDVAFKITKMTPIPSIIPGSPDEAQKREGV
jgi:hypothetical protein